MLILLKVHTNNPNIRDFRFKTYSGAFMQAEYTKNSGYSMVFFRKIGKITILHTKLISSIKFVGRKLRKIGFFAKTSNVLKSFSLQLVAQYTIVEHTENSHNSRLYTIQHKSVRNSHLLSQKSGISSSATTIVISTSVNCSHTKISKEQLTPHTSIVKRIMVSVTNTHLSSSNALLCQLVSQTHKLLKQLKPTDIANCNIYRYNGSFFSY